MRGRGILLLSILLLAGCSAPEEDRDAAAPSPTPASPASATPAPDASPPSPTPAPTAAAPTPPANASSEGGSSYSGFWTHSHADAPRTITFVVPEGTRPTTGIVTFTPSGGSGSFDCAAPDVRVEVADPQGVVLRAGPPERCGLAERADDLAMRAGTWTIWFNGSGAVASSVLFGSEGGSSSSEGSTVPFSHEERHDFQEAEETVEFTVPADAARADVRMSFEPRDGAPLCVVPTEAAIELRRPDGSIQGRHAIGGGLVGTDTCGGGRIETGVVLPPGVWSVAFTGAGAAVGILSISPEA